MKKAIITGLSVFAMCLVINAFAEKQDALALALAPEPTVVEASGPTVVESFQFVAPANERQDENIPEVQATYVVNQIDNSEAFTYSPQGEEMLIVKYDDGTFSCEAQGPNDAEQGGYVEPGLE